MLQHPLEAKRKLATVPILRHTVRRFALLHGRRVRVLVKEPAARRPLDQFDT